MSDERRPVALAGPGGMLFSAALFGYFGFGFLMKLPMAVSSNYHDQAGQFVLFWALLHWTLMGSAVGFLLAAAVTTGKAIAGNALYAVVSLVGSVLFVVVALMDIADDTRIAAVPPVLLLIFAAWNGFGAWSGLKSVMVLLHADAGR